MIKTVIVAASLAIGLAMAPIAMADADTMPAHPSHHHHHHHHHRHHHHHHHHHHEATKKT